MPHRQLIRRDPLRGRVSLLVALLALGLAAAAGFFVAWRDASGGGAESPRAFTAESPAAAPAGSEPAQPFEQREQLAQREIAAEPATDSPVQEEHGAFLRVAEADGAPAADLELCVAFAMRGQGGESMLYGSHDRITDENGELDLGELLAQQKRAELVVLGAKDALEPSVLERTMLGATRAAAAIVVRRPRALAAVRGVAIDAASGAPVTDYPLRLLSWVDAADPVPARGLALAKPEALRVPQRTGSGEWLVTDAAGRFASRWELPPARVHFLSYEKQGLAADHRIGPDGRGIDLRLELEIGPIVLLDFDPPSGYAPDDFIAALRRDGNEHPVFIKEVATPRDPHGGMSGSGNAGPVQAGPPPWVRLLSREIKGDPLPSFLVLESRDRCCFGSALVEELERYAREPLRVELATREVLSVRVVWPPDDEQGRALGMLLVTATPADAAPDAEPAAEQWVSRTNHETATDAKLLGLGAGLHRVVAVSQPASWDPLQVVPIERELELPSDELVVLEPRLGAPIGVHELELFVRTASGEPLDGREGRAELFGINLRGSGSGSRIEWSAGVARVVIREVAAGRAEPFPIWSRGWFPIEPADASFDVPGEPPELVVRDDLPSDRLVVRVIEPEVGGSVGLSVGSGNTRMYDQQRFGLEALEQLADGRRAAVVTSGPFLAASEPPSVTLFMPDHERVWLLDGSDIPPPDTNGQRIIELHPRRGWSGLVHVVTALHVGASPAEPVAGIVLAFDGVETPASDDEGYLIHRALSEPTRIALVTPGWEVVQRTSYFGRGTVHASGAVTFERGELTVLVRRKR